MDLPAILDIAIALIFIYLILSLLASEIQEIIAAFLQWRAKNLKEAIEILLGGVVQKQPTNPEELGQLPTIETKTKEADVKNAITLANKLYQNSLIQSLNQTTLRMFIRSSKSGPSYIPSETFTSALLEELELDKVLQEFRKNDQFKKDIVEIVEKIKLSDLSINLKKNLTIFAKRAQRKTQNIDEQIYQFEREIETWFDQSMERASGVYKRNAKGFAIVLGCLIAAGANADTLRIFSMLSKDAVLSAGISQYANQTVQICEKEKPDNYLDCINSKVNKNELSKLSLPIGWNSFPQFNKEPQIVFKKIIGLLLTGLAISMGASFWFDLLNKFINVRYAGKKPTASNETSDSSK
ncbi:hypothetical protein [Synechocystis sp. PCC 7509]|uniref:hypothetical protein n=1 Tax=Synechocystis sp. PCC 7509 TaxID=927677 RepID=UPI0002ACDA55|nr:hypothetical protein [Synechocystis sp. PCC 7509]